MTGPASGPVVEADVAIVGHGPVGAVLAILLAQQGHRVVVLERWPTPYVLPRAVHFDHEVGRLLQGCGIGAGLEVISEPAEVYEWRNAAGTPLLRFGRRGLGASGWPESSMFNQPALEALLAERVAALPAVTVRRGVEVVGVEQDVDGVTLDGRTEDGPTAVRARYAIGCDGAGSTVRDRLGVDVEDLGFFHDWLIVDLVLHDGRTFDPINVQVCDPERPTTAVSGGPGRRRWEFMRLPGESPAAMDDEATAWRLLEPWAVTPATATLERRAIYTFQARWAREWQRGRVLLAGDAAHQMPPFAGQGLCAGIRDAASLAWRLDLVLGGAPDALLASYQDERLDHVRAVIELSMALGRVICVPDPAEAAARDAAMAAGVVDGGLQEVPPLPGVTTGVRHPGSPGAGSVLPQQVDEGAGGRVRQDDVVGAGWRVVVRAGSAACVPVLPSWFAGLGGRVVVAGAGSVCAGWLRGHGAGAAVVRPDHVVYGTARDPAGLPALLDELRRGLGMA